MTVMKSKIHSLSFLALALLVASGVHARTWTSADGKSTIEGELIEYDAGIGLVTLDRSGNKVTFKREFLSKEDVAFLEDKATAGPPRGSDWKPIPELTDEFEGKALDATKWHDHDPGWKGRMPGFFSPKNVTVNDGKLHLTARVETLANLPKGYHTFTTAAVKSKALVKYGFFEIKCRPMKSKASSAFWFYRSEKEIWTEIDVFEICGVEDKWKNTYNMNAHVFHTPTEKKHFQRPGKWKAPFDFVDGYHVYGLEWNQQVIKWLVNGKVVHELKNTHWHQPLNMLFDSETFPEWFGLPSKESLPATFSIEYVRSWSRREDS
jgi:beta-glucanase (GH16 family)